jgi:hypothetical protein
MRKTTITLFIVLAVAAAPAIVDAAMSSAAGVGGSALTGTGRQALLYDQTNDPSGNGAPDQDFEALYDTYDCEGADDFDVTWADGWNVQQIQTVGTQTSGGTASTAKVTLFADASGTPGAQLCAYSGLAVIDTAGALTINLPTDCFVGVGMAWVAVQAQQDFATAGQHFWSNRTTQSFATGLWRNPGDGFASGCTTWSPLASCIGSSGTPVGGGFPDFLFQVWGAEAQGPTPTPPPPVGASEPVPTLNTYGIVAMVLLLVGVGILVMWRRS